MRMTLRAVACVLGLALIPLGGCSDDDDGDTGPCGNGVIDDGEGEECDTVVPGGLTCEDYGFEGGGVLSCDDLCLIDTTECEATELCGDGVIERFYGEECDGEELDDQTCESLGYLGGVLVCSTQCHFDTSGCEENPLCGNGEVDPTVGEQCDGANLDGETCASLGHYGGDLECTEACQFDRGGCGGFCGNFVPDGGEVCDGVSLGGEDCISLGFAGGILACAQDCMAYDTTGCEAPDCGDGVIEGDEECDGVELDGQDCTTLGLGFTGGTLACLGSCDFDLSGCTTCGDGVVEGGEVCDGTDLDGEDCASLGAGFTGGVLTCDASCQDWVTTECTTCGDGQLETGEECDDGNQTDGDGCQGDCLLPVCGDGILDTGSGEECDDGAGNSDTDPDACRMDCSLPACGDDVVDTGEECDDGNTTSLDGCRDDCLSDETCGNGLCDPHEACDVCVADCGACPCLPDANEVNDATGTATPLSQGPQTCGLTLCVGDVDWFDLGTPNNSFSIELVFDPTGDPLYLDVYEGATWIGGDSSGTSPFTYIQSTVNAGSTYRAYVYTANGLENPAYCIRRLN